MSLVKSDSLKELATALSRAQALMEGAKKDAANPYYKSKYANLEAVWECARKPLSDNGLSVVQMPGKSELGHFLETTLLHSSGEFISGRMFICPIKEDPQGIGSAITYARRYSLMAALGIAPEDDDGEAAMGRNHVPRQENKEPVLKNERLLPGSKGSKSEDKWEAVIWHPEFGTKKNGNFAYKGHSLAEIQLNDPEGLRYWIEAFDLNKTFEDKALRLALDKARKDLPADSQGNPEEAKEAKPEPSASKTPLEDLQELCSVNEVPPSLVLDFAKEKGAIPKKTKFLSECPPDIIQKAVSGFQFFIDLHASNQAKAKNT